MKSAVPPPRTKPFVWFYHQDVFGFLTMAHGGRLDAALHSEPLQFRLTHFLPAFVEARDYEMQETWDICFRYLGEIEKALAALLRKHSVYFWVHLMRRIGVKLSPKHHKTDSTTLGLVREIAELAISKYGSLDRNDDLELTSDVHLKQVLGGYFKRFHERKIGVVNTRKLFRSISNQWVLTDFNLEDFVTIYRVEGLAYEYWRTTALMRGVGKGQRVIGVKETWPRSNWDEPFGRLIDSYDERIIDLPFSSSLLGSWFQTKTTTNESLIVMPFYNTNNDTAEELFNAFGIHIPPEANFTPNFLIAPFDFRHFVTAHEFMQEPFERHYGMSLGGFLATLWGLSQLVITGSGGEYKDTNRDEDCLGLSIINVAQRAYAMARDDITHLADRIFAAVQLFNSDLEVDVTLIAKALRILSLTQERQGQIGLWSGGPRYPLVPFGNCILINIEGLDRLLSSLFYRLQYEQTRRGTVFEEAFRRALADEGFSIDQVGVITTTSGEKREIDASVRIGDELIVFECRSIERPLDYEIGRPNTLSTRQRLLDEKVDQVLSLVRLIEEEPTGRNYDFVWASNVTAVVVSPFIEWIWDNSSRLWLDKDVPRIMQADEVIRWLKKKAQVK